jgi:8-oxo-dGTP diphosphatase
MEPITYEFKPGEKYPVIMVCTDAVVFCKDPIHGLVVAMIERSDNKKFALPGGFVEYDETSLMASQRELEEETGLSVRKSLSAVSSKYIGYLHFDDPSRTAVGNRKITTAHVFMVDKMVELNGGDDATKAFWVRVEDLSDGFEIKKEEIHDDHRRIILDSVELLNK